MEICTFHPTLCFPISVTPEMDILLNYRLELTHISTPFSPLPSSCGILFPPVITLNHNCQSHD